MKYQVAVPAGSCYKCQALVQTAGGWNSCKICGKTFCNEHAKAKFVCPECLASCSHEAQDGIIKKGRYARSWLVWGVVLPIISIIGVIVSGTTMYRINMMYPTPSYTWVGPVLLIASVVFVVISFLMPTKLMMRNVNDIEETLIAQLNGHFKSGADNHAKSEMEYCVGLTRAQKYLVHLATIMCPGSVRALKMQNVAIHHAFIEKVAGDIEAGRLEGIEYKP